MCVPTDVSANRCEKCVDIKPPSSLENPDDKQYIDVAPMCWFCPEAEIKKTGGVSLHTPNPQCSDTTKGCECYSVRL